MTKYQLKIKITQYTIGIIVYDENIYKKYLIATGHPDNSNSICTNSSKNEYEKYGTLYYYDGNINHLKSILKSYNPEYGNVDFLVCLLTTECDLKCNTFFINIKKYFLDFLYNIISYDSTSTNNILMIKN